MCKGTTPPPSASGIPVNYGPASIIPVNYGPASRIPVNYGPASRIPLYFELEPRKLIDKMFKKNPTLRTVLQYVPSLVLTMETFPENIASGGFGMCIPLRVPILFLNGNVWF